MTNFSTGGYFVLFVVTYSKLDKGMSVTHRKVLLNTSHLQAAVEAFMHQDYSWFFNHKW